MHKEKMKEKRDAGKEVWRGERLGNKAWREAEEAHDVTRLGRQAEKNQVAAAWRRLSVAEENNKETAEQNPPTTERVRRSEVEYIS